MKKIIINGLKELTGKISISGAKNSVVALIPASIMTDEVVTITNVPRLSDTENLQKIINLLNGKIEFGHGVLTIDGKDVKSNLIPNDLSSKLRASYYFMGALLARFHRVEIFIPGGCKIGSRPIDMHLDAFSKMGVNVQNEGDKFTLSAEHLHGANIDMRFPSVGATVNVMLAASLADGETVITNAAKEPEIVNIANMLNAMGADIKGAGSSRIVIHGVDKLHGTEINTIPDRIEAGTYIMIGALVGRDLTIDNIVPDHLKSLFSCLDEMGVKYAISDHSVVISKVDSLRPLDIITEVYPGFPTDLAQPMSVLLTQASGSSKYKETIYENRVGQFPELIKMGANIDFDLTEATIIGPAYLHGEDVSATDLRAGASLIIAGLIADGTTKISNIEYILRGYEDIVEKLKNVGADISIIDE